MSRTPPTPPATATARTGDAVDHALDQLADPDRDARQAAAMALGERADPATGGELVERLWCERDPFVRETVTWAVARTAGTTTPLLVAVLGDADAAVRLQALHVLSKIADPATVDAVLPLVGDQDPLVAAKARWALARIGDPRAVPVLVEDLGTDDETARNGLTRDLASFGAHAVPALVGALADERAPVRRHAAEVLCFIGADAQDATDALVAALDDTDAEARVSAAMALLDVGTARSLAALRRATTATDPRLRAIAARA